MPFEWSQFKCVGEELHRLSRLDDPACGEEALVRSAVGRLYYSVFKPVEAVQAVDRRSYPDVGSHERVFRSLEDDGWEKIANRFRQFRALRVEADYHLERSTPDLDRWYRRAELAVESLENMIEEAGLL